MISTDSISAKIASEPTWFAGKLGEYVSNQPVVAREQIAGFQNTAREWAIRIDAWRLSISENDAAWHPVLPAISNPVVPVFFYLFGQGWDSRIRQASNRVELGELGEEKPSRIAFLKVLEEGFVMPLGLVGSGFEQALKVVAEREKVVLKAIEIRARFDISQRQIREWAKDNRRPYIQPVEGKKGYYRIEPNHSELRSHEKKEPE